MHVHVVDNDLPDDVTQALMKTPLVAVDTETSGLDWRVDSLHLCQIYAPVAGAYVVRNVQQAPANLGRLLSSPEVTKVFHFAPFDLRFLMSRWGVDVANVACTKAASKLLAPHIASADHSLAALTAHYLDVSLEKGATRTSDWGASTLTDEQLQYAVNDVAYLLPLLKILTDRLRELDREQVFRRVCTYIPTAARLEIAGFPDPLTY